MLPIDIRSIPHDAHRYPTVGDWIHNPEATYIRVSDMGNEDYEFLVAVHELIEQHLCRKRGITEEAVNDFDIEYEANRKDGDVSEPGNDPTAPYQSEHAFATFIERLIANELGVVWREYEKAVDSL